MSRTRAASRCGRFWRRASETARRRQPRIRACAARAGGQRRLELRAGGAGRIELSERFSPSLEYYSGLGPVPSFLPVAEQLHQILPSGDLKLAKNVEWSFGVGIGTTPAGNRLVYKSRFEISFGVR